MMVALRLAVYLDLLLLFGLSAYPLYAVPGYRLLSRTALVALSLAGLVLGGGAWLAMVADMAGTSPLEVDRDTVLLVLLETGPGIAFMARSGALIAVILLLMAAPGRGLLIAIAAAAALGSLAWTGHAAVAEGMAGVLHKGSDILHLLAAGAWLGALVALLRMLIGDHVDAGMISTSVEALAGFARAGSLLVVAIIATGVTNAVMILGSGFLRAATSLYGELLLLKIALFGSMLGLAALNRWRLTPRLASAQVPQAGSALSALRVSVALEVSAGIAIVVLVSWLGTLAPPSS